MCISVQSTYPRGIYEPWCVAPPVQMFCWAMLQSHCLCEQMPEVAFGGVGNRKHEQHGRINESNITELSF